MKKHLLFGAVLMLVLNSFAQDNGGTNTTGGTDNNITFEIQAKGSGNSTWLFNKNISDQGDSQDYAAGWGWNYGLAGSMYFGKIGFTIEALFGNHHGNYEGTENFFDPSGALISAVAYESNVNLKLFELPVLFKMKNVAGTYFELGVQYSSITSATYERSTNTTSSENSVTSDYAKDFFSAVLGFGWQYQIKESDWAILGGLRFKYSFTNLEGVDALDRPFDDSSVYADPEKTDALAGGIMLGVVYTLGRK